MSDTTFPDVLVFDVNETLLDITTLSPLFGRVFGDEGVLREWFAQLVLYSQTLTLAHRYTPFGELGVGVLKMVADIHQVTLKDSDIDYDADFDTRDQSSTDGRSLFGDPPATDGESNHERSSQQPFSNHDEQLRSDSAGVRFTTTDGFDFWA